VSRRSGGQTDVYACVTTVGDRDAQQFEFREQAEDSTWVT
jgi:hypothetical protein